MAYIHMAKEKK